eukprot:CAMPEP_0118867966 /NCGR_PEP_ID=MMETSP1163-20130328/11410_1 /TAXON_ID=124430 /ORGANISM="Phaeomonas parva, Strain CCMP2877" /LENGTH=379 /DNA_ID=CAMNT_0006802467 /DNA_START=79 /DNA_END=1214 /DNA_ORIENTATION=+
MPKKPKFQLKRLSIKASQADLAEIRAAAEATQPATLALMTSQRKEWTEAISARLSPRWHAVAGKDLTTALRMRRDTGFLLDWEANNSGNASWRPNRIFLFQSAPVAFNDAEPVSEGASGIPEGLPGFDGRQYKPEGATAKVVVEDADMVEGAQYKVCALISEIASRLVEESGGAPDVAKLCERLRACLSAEFSGQWHVIGSTRGPLDAGVVHDDGAFLSLRLSTEHKHEASVVLWRHAAPHAIFDLLGGVNVSRIASNILWMIGLGVFVLGQLRLLAKHGDKVKCCLDEETSPLGWQVGYMLELIMSVECVAVDCAGAQAEALRHAERVQVYGMVIYASVVAGVLLRFYVRIRDGWGRWGRRGRKPSPNPSPSPEPQQR